MKKKTKVFLTILLVFLLLAGGFLLRQRNNLRALRYGLTMESASLEQQLEDSQQTIHDAMEDFSIPEYDFSEEDLAALTDGSLSVEDAAEKILSEKAPAPSAPTEPDAPQTPAAVPDSQPPAAPAPQEPVLPVDERIQQCVAEMYVLQAVYEEKLNIIMQSAIDEYASGELTQERKEKAVVSRILDAMALEKECDAAVSDVVTRLRALLKEAGQDDSLAVRIEDAYREQKSLKKAQYLKKYRGE